MANTREIQSRMKSIQDTMKITNAMYTISSSKLKKARKTLTDTEPYFYSLQQMISRILRHIPEMDNPYFDARPQIKPEDRKIGYIVVSADKGLAGAYNHNILKLAEEKVRQAPNVSLYIVGQVGRAHFTEQGIPVAKEFLDIDKRAVKDFQNGLLEYFDRVHPEIGQEIEANKALTDELTQKILDVTAEYKSKK